MRFLFFFLPFLFACNSSGKSPVSGSPVEGESKIIAVYTNPDGSKSIDVLMRVIQKKIVTDSVKKTDRIVYDTIWGVSKVVPRLDEKGKPKLDSLKRPLYDQFYVLKGKDSVNTHIENIPVDSLLKKQ